MSAPGVYHLGTDVRLEAEFKVKHPTTGVYELTDPTTVTLKIMAPDKTVTTYTYAAGEITRLSVGKYRKDYEPTTAGEWKYRYIGTATAKGAKWSSFTMLPSEIS